MSSHLDFLRNLQRVLDEGTFVATYKYALLQSLADLSVEKQAEADGSMRIPISEIAEKFIRYYWRQSLPYRGADAVLRQNSGKQAAVVNYVAEARERYDGSLSSAAKDSAKWRQLRTSVSSVIRNMPLWKLQLVAGEQQEFLYRRDEYRSGAIRLLPDAVESFRDMYVIVSNFIKGSWIGQIQRIGYNREILGEIAGLPEFMFGTERESLEKYKRILREYQRSRCFYCGAPVKTGDLDHFIPWSRYPIDLGHNFVFAHPKCNSQKRDFLAHVDHLSRWKDTNLADRAELAAEFKDAGLAHDAARSEQVTIWAYGQGEAAGVHAWSHGDEFLKLGPEWRNVLISPDSV